MTLSLAVTGPLAKAIAGGLMTVIFGYMIMRATGAAQERALAAARGAGEGGRDWIAGIIGGTQHAFMSWRARRALRRERLQQEEEEARGDILTRLAPRPPTMRGSKNAPRIEPVLTRADRRPLIDPEPEPEYDQSEEEEEDAQAVAEDELYDDEDGEDAPAPVTRVNRNDKPIKQGKKIRKDSQPGFKFGKSDGFELPPLTLLSEPKRVGKSPELSDEALEQNARMLEGVLEDFGVKGQIIKVRPGPVVTLYELEPAPGIKSSRVISLADDIARSMSAISARVAVVPGRNAIGIELPNAKRETVFLRELLASEAYEKTSLNLALALGKNIGGEPVFADLARMPHVLIAGTTGSGKSVGINTMVLSLLYRLPPDRCKLIMIDPK
ncbi:MAG: DNA translocase FtsK, partial [Alphaproteobacteria bacterium]|nr:DNA translocase FtsK [Alphaproteobacteria bacterium]